MFSFFIGITSKLINTLSTYLQSPSFHVFVASLNNCLHKEVLKEEKVAIPPHRRSPSAFFPYLSPMEKKKMGLDATLCSDDMKWEKHPCLFLPGSGRWPSSSSSSSSSSSPPKKNHFHFRSNTIFFFSSFSYGKASVVVLRISPAFSED